MADVIRRDDPELRIVDEETWAAVQSRLRAVSAFYTKSSDGKPKGRAVPGRASKYLFSSLLYCDACGGKMVISGGSGSAYYRCEGHAKRGTCKNDLSVKEVVVRSSLLDELRHRLAASDGILYARKRIAERLGELKRTLDTELREHRARLEKLERTIDRYVEFIAEGHHSSAVASKLKVAEREAEQERRVVSTLEKRGSVPIRLPTPDEMLRIVFDLEKRLMSDVARGREQLRRLFRDERITLLPKPGGFYVARSEILPLVLLTQPPPEELSGGRYTASGCAGRI